MLKSPAPLIVFDLDGTLVDSAPDLVDTLNVILDREGHGPVSLEAGRKMVGAGARSMIQRGLQSHGASVSDEKLSQMFDAYLSYYEDHITDNTTFYPGAEAALDKLASAGWSLAILTNKYEKPAVKLVGALGALSRFAVVAGQDTYPVCKPDAGALFHTIEKAGGDPRQSIMVGDTITDVSTAQNAKIPVIAVDFGYADRPVATMNPDRIISHFDDLFDAAEAIKSGFPVTA